MHADLFDWRPVPAYPAVPGARAMDTSKAAAEHVAPDAARLRRLVLDCIAAAPAGLTADEVAERLGLSVLSARPRVTELNKMGAIKDAGIRRKNASGRNAAVWIGA